MLKNIFLVGILCFISVSTYSEEAKKDEKEPKYIFGLVVFEALIGVNAWMASESPSVYGGAAALLFPLAGGSENTGKITYWSGLVAAESLAVYNLSLNEDEYTKSEIFKNNMIAWHVFAGVVVAAGLVENKFFNKDTVTFIPDRNGGHIAFSYKY